MAEARAPTVDDELLDEVVRRILAVGQPERIILFGSQARGTAGPWSDIDLLVIEASELPRWERGGKYLSALSGIGPDRDVVVWTPEEFQEWQDVPNSLPYNAVADGRLLFERADQARLAEAHGGSTRRVTGRRRAERQAQLAAGWMLKGDSDLVAAQRILTGTGPYDTAGYHAQQACEKYLKAFLCHVGATIEWTHDLDKLRALARQNGAPAALDAHNLTDLTHAAVTGRYDENYWPSREAAARMVATAEEVRALLDPLLTPPNP